MTTAALLQHASHAQAPHAQAPHAQVPHAQADPAVWSDDHKLDSKTRTYEMIFELAIWANLSLRGRPCKWRAE